MRERYRRDNYIDEKEDLFTNFIDKTSQNLFTVFQYTRFKVFFLNVIINILKHSKCKLRQEIR